MVVPHGHQNAAIGRGARHVGVFHRIARPVDARTLAVPEPEDPVELALAAQLGLLCAPERGGGQVFVQAFLKFHVRLGQLLGRAVHLHVDRTQRRAAIAGHISCGVQPRRPVACFLHQHEADKCLGAIQQHRAFFDIKTVG